jgi:hypothetical protein
VLFGDGQERVKRKMKYLLSRQVRYLLKTNLMASNLDDLDLLILGVLSLSQLHLRPEEVLVVKIKISISFGT